MYLRSPSAYNNRAIFADRFGSYFQPFYPGFDIVFAALEIDNSILLLVAATDMSRRDAASVISTTSLGLGAVRGA